MLHYPQDIKETMDVCHPALQPGQCVAFSLQFEYEEKLVVAQEVRPRFARSLVAEEIFEAVRAALKEEHDVEPYAILILKPSTLPKTASGKVAAYIV